MLDSTVESVNSALKRARASLRRQRPPNADRERPPAADSSSEDAIVAKFVSTRESADLDALAKSVYRSVDRKRLSVRRSQANGIAR